MTNISFRNLAQIRAKFRFFFSCWSLLYFKVVLSNLGSQVSLTKNFIPTLGCSSILIFDNFFIFLTDFQLSILRFFLSLLVKHFQTFSSLSANFFENFSNKFHNPFSLFYVYKFFYPLNTKKFN